MIEILQQYDWALIGFTVSAVLFCLSSSVLVAMLAKRFFDSYDEFETEAE